MAPTLIPHDTDREFPTPEVMGRRRGRVGFAPETTVVLSGAPVPYGAYAFWVLSMCGHPDVRLLDGARTRWAADGRPLSTETPRPSPVASRPPAAGGSGRGGRHLQERRGAAPRAARARGRAGPAGRHRRLLPPEPPRRPPVVRDAPPARLPERARLRRGPRGGGG